MADELGHEFVDVQTFDYPQGVRRCVRCGLYEHDLEVLKRMPDDEPKACVDRVAAQRDQAKP